MVTRVDLIKAEIARIERELEEAQQRLALLSSSSNVEKQPLSKLRGMLKGKVHFTSEDIAELKLRSR